MKKNWPIMILLNSPLLLAGPIQEAARQINTLEKVTPRLDCTESAEQEYPPPLEALKEVNTGKLTYLGRDLFPGNDQNRTCVYKSEKAYILYHNCLSSKKESSATDIEVISFDGNITSFYIQNADEGIPLSTQVRSQYNMTWRVSVTSSPAPGKLNLSQLKDYMNHNSPASSAGCFIGRTFKAQDMKSKAECLGELKSIKWTDAATDFWLNPPDEWYQTQKYLRRVVVETKF